MGIQNKILFITANNLQGKGSEVRGGRENERVRCFSFSHLIRSLPSSPVSITMCKRLFILDVVNKYFHLHFTLILFAIRINSYK